MFVVKRNGKHEKLQFEKITTRITRLSYMLSELVDVASVVQKVIVTLHSGVTTSEIDQHSARIAAQLVNEHPDYGILAARIAVADLHRNTPEHFSDVVATLHAYKDDVTGRAMSLVSDEVMGIVSANKERLNAAIDKNRDNDLTYFGLKTLERSYLLKVRGKIVECPQHMYLRVALGIHGNDVERALETYALLSKGYMSHASPTMFNAGTPFPQMASCFLLSMDGDQDSIASIYSTLGKCATISKNAGGIGLHVHTIRSAGSYIAGTNGTSNGLVPMLKVYNATAKYVDQGGNKRPGAFAIYLEPWHGDIFHFLDLKLQSGVEDLRARDLFYALWIPDLFMRRVEADASWTLMDPHQCPGLNTVWGDAFDTLYEQYEREGRGLRTIKAQELWSRIIRNQKETGTPYVLFKDHCNRKSNQQNLGTIESSNLCVSSETLITTDEGPVAIGDLVLGPNRLTRGQSTDEYHKTAREIQAMEEKLKADNPSRQDKETLVILKAKLATLPNPDDVDVPFSPRPVNVWNGVEWSRVTPACTGKQKQLVRVTTTHGTILDCTPEHEFILKTGERCQAQALTLGVELALPTKDGSDGRGVVYHGIPTQALPEDVAFRRGYVYAYILGKVGSSPENLGPKPPAVKVPVVVMTKESTLPKTLEYFHYNQSEAERLFKVDHNLLAVVRLEDNDQQMQTRVSAPVATRQLWVDGFLACIHNNFGEIKASYVMLHRAWLMLRSVGLDIHLVPVNKTGLWRLRKGDGSHPAVAGVLTLPEAEDTYCFTEPLQHAGVFNELLTGQCSEIIQYSNPDEIAVCNLASVCLNRFVLNGQFQFALLQDVTKKAVYNMNRIIDRNLYLIPEMKRSNLKHRPIGLGVQGLADTFAMLHLPWESAEARLLNKQIFETMYFAALEASCALAQSDGPYASFPGSPASKGILQFHMWNVEPTTMHDWKPLMAKIVKHGLRNSLLLTVMPTASTAQILGNNESIEPFTSNMYTRSVLSGQFQVVNKYLIDDLIARNLWTNDIIQDMIQNNGSIQAIACIPDDLKAVYKTVWEIPQRVLIDMAADRGAFICQSQSFNLHMRDPTDNQLHNALFYGWEKGLKTGMYYLRTRPAVDPIKFTVDPTRGASAVSAAMACARDNPEACVMCSA
jgi:ribonucleotide reductase alpha subunit